MEGNKQKMLGNYAEAIAYYAKCLQINEKSAATMYELANMYILQGDISTALILTQEAVKVNPDNIWYKLLLAALYQQKNMLSKSAGIYKELVKEHPYNIEYKLEYASILSLNNKLKEALKIYDDIELKYGVIDEISLEKEKIYMKLGEKEKAYEELNKLIIEYPLEVRFYGLLAEIYVSNEEYDKALATYNKLLKIDPDNGLGHLSLSEFYRITNDFDKSFEEIKIAFASPDVKIDIKIKMILLYYSSSRVNVEVSKQTYELLAILEETHPDDPKSLAVYGDFLISDEKWEEAREKYRKVIENTKNNYLIWEQLIFIDNQLNDFKALYYESKEALEYFPNQVNLYLFNGIGAIKQKKFDEAIEKLKTGLGLTVNKKLEVQFYIYLAEAYFKNKNNEESDKYFDKALELEQDNLYILNNYSYYLSLRSEKLNKALEMTKKCNELTVNNATYLDTYAWVLYKMQNYEEALTIIEKAIEHGGGGSAVIIEHKGDILYKSGKIKKAVEIWKKAKETGKGSEFLDKKVDEEKMYE